MSVRTVLTSAAAGAAVLAALGGAAFALDTVEVPTVAAPVASVTGSAAASPTSSPPTSADSPVAVPVERAREIAVAAAGGGSVTGIETEVEHGRPEWKVTVLAGGVEHDVRVDAGSGAVTRQEVDDDHGGDHGGRGRR